MNPIQALMQEAARAEGADEAPTPLHQAAAVMALREGAIGLLKIRAVDQKMLICTFFARSIN